MVVVLSGCPLEAEPAALESCSFECRRWKFLSLFGHLFQCLVTDIVKYFLFSFFLLVSNLNFPCNRLCLLLLALALYTSKIILDLSSLPSH